VAVNALADQVSPLFIIQRNKNVNEVHYDVNIGDDGKISSKKPVVAYWIMKAKSGQREKLGFFEKKAYGFECKYDKKKGIYRLVIKSFKKRAIEVSGDKQGVKAEIIIDGKPAYLEKLFINANNAKPFPKVSYIELYGKDKETGKKVYEKISV
jgi:hypothetical protein